ncbi:hypothetical protein Syun_003397 [Stephania yunnanensis]|uniref:Pentatricopeptide repeat-containing protein n=1 Tax=Stephania yunnanensis TaxID=152371 RepID=A0AAP0L3P1_9MAGN
MDIDLQFCVSRALRSCRSGVSIQQGRQAHLSLIKTGLFESALFVKNSVLQMYGKCGSLADAHKLFDEMPERNSFTWNTLIEAHLRSGNKGPSLDLFNSMPCKNEYSWNAIITGFAKSGDFKVARKLFDEMPVRTGIALNSVLHGYMRNGHVKEAVLLFKEFNMDPVERSGTDAFVLATMLGVCSEGKFVMCGKQIHGQLIVGSVNVDSVMLSSLVNMYAKCEELDAASLILSSYPNPDEYSSSALISGYAKCGRLADARRVFEGGKQCVVSWNSMISGYVANSQAGEALVLFDRMKKLGISADYSTFTSVLSGCTGIGVLQNGKQVHAQACKLGFVNDMIIASALIDMYSKCGSPDDACRAFSEVEIHDTVLLNSMINLYSTYRRVADARQVFDAIPNKSLISWNSMIVCYSQNGCAVEALGLFCNMQRLDLGMDKVTLASAVSACASICTLRLGEQIFCRATIIGLESDQIFSSSLIDLYCRCGIIIEGRRIFDEMAKSDEVPWNSLLMGYSTNGYGTEALELFEEMRNAGVSPNSISFTGVLSACSHSGLVKEGKRWFYSMKPEYDVEPEIEHYSCIIDLCTRAGFLEDAMDLIEHMPFKADASMWSAVLRGCVAHGNKALGNRVAERMVELDPENSCAYVQLASMHANTGDWEKSAQIRRMMQGRRVVKDPSCSWIEVE